MVLDNQRHSEVSNVITRKCGGTWLYPEQPEGCNILKPELGIRLGSWPPWVTYKDPVLKSQESHIYFSTCLLLTPWLLSQCLGKELMQWEPGSPKWTTVAREIDRVMLQNSGWLPCESEGRGSELGNRDVRLSPFDLDLSIYFAQNQVSIQKRKCVCWMRSIWKRGTPFWDITIFKWETNDSNIFVIFLFPAIHSAHLSKLNELWTLTASLLSETDPCAGRNECAHLCQSENGVARCACHAGYQLSADKKACEGRKLKVIS